MSISRRLPTALLALMCAAASLAQEGASPSPPAPPRPPAPADGGEQAEAPPAADERPEVENDEFIPTEELQPDAAVTFPVDI